MKKLNVLLAFVTLSIMCCEIVNAQKVRGEGPVVTQTIEMREISNVGLGISANVYLTQGKSQAIKIIGQQNIIDLIKKEADGDSWDIKFPRNTNVSYNEKLEIHITLKDLESLNVGGSGSIIGESAFRNLEDVKINIGGSGSVTLELQAQELDCNIGGSGSIKLKGSATELSANIGGSGSVRAINLRVKEAKVNTAGSGSVTVDVSDELTATLVGSGGVKYKGDPKVNKTIMGSGRVKAY